MYESDFRAADEAYYSGRVAAATKARESVWSNWERYVAPLGLDPFLEMATHSNRIRALSGFAARARTGFFGRGRTVQSGTVSSQLSSIGSSIAMATGANPTKVHGSDKYAPRLSQMLDGMSRADPPTEKKLPVEADVPEWLAMAGTAPGATELIKAVGDNALIAFYFLLRIGEYSTRPGQANDKLTDQFKVKDVTFFKRVRGRLKQLGPRATKAQILSADAATLRIGNQKNGWKNVCIHHEATGDLYYCCIKALGRRVVHIMENGGTGNTWLSAYWEKGESRRDVTDKDMRAGIKMAAQELDYPGRKGIPIERVDTHSLRIGGATVLALSGYTDTQIQKMGRWRSATFKEYVRSELAGYSTGMSKAMKKNFDFVHVVGDGHTIVTDMVVGMDYDVRQ